MKKLLSTSNNKRDKKNRSKTWKLQNKSQIAIKIFGPAQTKFKIPTRMATKQKILPRKKRILKPQANQSSEISKYQTKFKQTLSMKKILRFFLGAQLTTTEILNSFRQTSIIVSKKRKASRRERKIL